MQSNPLSIKALMGDFFSSLKSPPYPVKCPVKLDTLLKPNTLHMSTEDSKNSSKSLKDIFFM
jgi:hypothetical protein